MKKNCTKRIAALALAFVMLLSYVPSTAWAVDADTDIKAIQKPTGWIIVEDYDDYFGDAWLEKLGLPETVKVTLADNTIVDAPVEWDVSVLDTRTTGYYSVPGTVTLPNGSTNSQNLGVTITIQVAQKKNLFVNGNFENKGAYVPVGWNMPGLDIRYTTEFARTGNVAGWARGTNAADVKRNGYNKDGDESPENVAARVAALGAGQYYFGIYARKGDNAVEQTFQAQFFYRVNGETSTPATQKPTGTKLTLSTQYQASCGIVDMPENVTFVQMQFNFYKTDTTVTFDQIGSYVDDAELIPLKTVLKVEPSAIAEVKTEILSRKVVQNYPDYVGENWKDALGLPSSVEVLTDNGSVANVDVTWSFAGLDFTKYGKYTLVGKLDDSGFPNPKGLTVEQTIYVTKATNLIPNPSFESDLTGWYLRGLNPSPAKVQTPVKDGSYAAMSGNWSPTKTAEGIVESRYMTDALTAAVAQLGGGQFYYSIWAQASVANNMRVQNWIYYKTVDADGNLSGNTITKGNQVAFSHTEYVQSTQIVDLPANVGWFGLYLYAIAPSVADQNGAPFYVDHAELIALNVTIPKGQEPADVTEVVTELPPRAVIQNYDKYVGQNWEAKLGLPTTVSVRTSNGNTTSVGVTWDYSSLNLKKEGKYYLVGTLDDSTCPNPDSLYVTQLIYIREYKNLLPNGDIEGGLDSWYLRGMNPSPSLVTDRVYSGKYAALSGAMVSERLSEAVANNKMVDELGAAINLQGGGQYYYSAWMLSAAKTQIEGLTFQTRFLYKTTDENGTLSTSVTKLGDKVNLNNKEYVQSIGLVELPANTTWARLDLMLGAQSSTDLCAAPVYIDYAEVLPLNIVVEQYEGQMVQVETVIPSRNIIQNYPDYIGDGYTVADLMFPETVEVISSMGQTVRVGVRWNYDTLDLTKLGTYTVVGSLEDMKLANPDALTVSQVVNVVSYNNLIRNGGFEDFDDFWDVDSSRVSIEAGIMSPVKQGSLALRMVVGRLQSFDRDWIQALYPSETGPLGLRITAAGGGRYYFGGWAQGGERSANVQFYTRLWYRSVSSGDSALSKTAATTAVSNKEYRVSGAVVDLPDDIYYSHLDLYLIGSGENLRYAELFIDQMELVPLNVEVPGMNDIIKCEDVADVFVHQGTSTDNLDLPATLEIMVKSGQKFQIKVKWNFDSYNPNQIGEQTITGTLELGTRFRNIKKFVPTVRVTVRAKGEDLRQTIYISTSGSEDNDGLSPQNPKKEITNIPTYLEQGYNVRLKKGDIWYIPTGSLTFKNLFGTEQAPLTVTSYGEGSRPVIGFMMKIEDSAWKLVDEKRNIWSTNVSAFGEKNGESVHRCFVADEAYFHKTRSNYATLGEGEYCSYNKTLYIRMPAGETPKRVEVTPYGSGSTRMYIENVSYLTFEDIHIKGASSIFPVIRMDAPTKYVKFTKCDITHTWYYNFLLEASDEQIHYKPEFSYLYMDTFANPQEGSVSGYDGTHWNPHGIEGITMRDGVEGAWIHHNHLRNMAHAFIAIESLDKDTESKTRGVYNCVIEDNVLEGGNIWYARAFNICGGYNLSGVQICRDNTYRRNRCYDMTVASHLYGENNLIYSNLFSYAHTSYNEDGSLFDGKGVQPWGFDTIPWNDHGSVGNMLVNNTFYDVAGAIGIYDKAHTVYNNIYANNLVVNWESDPNADKGGAGAFFDSTVGFNYMMNNAVYSEKGYLDHFMVDGKIYTADDVNFALTGYSNNLYGDPKFVNVDMTLLGKGVRQEFTLSKESSFRYAGLSLYSPVYEIFPAWKRMMADYTDVNGVVYLAESPSIGAWSFSEKIRGDVAEVGQLDYILCRPGATFDQLLLPDAVPAVNDQGIDVMLLVTWDAAQFDSSKPGTVTLSGELRNGPHTELNILGKKAYIDIVIKDRLELKSIVTEVPTLTVLFGTSYEDAIAQLPAKLHVVEESGFEDDLPVSWVCDDYDGLKPGDYTFQCVLPDDMITNAREFDLEVTVRVMHEIGRGVELLINPDFTDGNSVTPWKLGWLSTASGNVRITTDPELLPEGEPAGAIVTVGRRYASIQQDVTGQVQLLGDGKYLFRLQMRAYEATEPIDSSYGCVQLLAPITVTHRTRPKKNIGTEYVEYYQIMDLQDVMNAQTITFHTSTGKSSDDAEEGPRSYIIAGCSFIYLGTTDAEVNATLDSIGLDWNAIKGSNTFDTQNVTSDLNLPATIGSASKIVWSSSDESAISSDGKVTMGRVPKTVTLTATITYKGIETVKRFEVTVPRNPNLPTFTGSLTGSQTVLEGDQFQVTISVSSDKVTTFNGYRFTVYFNSTRLKYIGISDPTATVEVDGGNLIISGIGTERPITDTITITFQAVKSSITEVKLIRMEMDLDPNATLETLPSMNIAGGAAVIDVQKLEAEKDDAAVESSQEDTSVIWIVIGLVAAALIAGGAIVIILIKKKKQTPPATEE